MELLCIEIESEPRGYLDPVFLDDERILRNLLLSEERYTISSSYFKCFQTELQTHMRKIVCSWMLEVSPSCLTTATRDARQSDSHVCRDPHDPPHAIDGRDEEIRFADRGRGCCSHTVYHMCLET